MDDQQWVTAQTNDNALKIGERKIVNGQVPDVTGMSLKDAVFLIENIGMKVRFSGNGKVRKQSLPGGSRIVKGGTVSGDETTVITSLCLDSRKVEAGSMFFAVRGSLADGHSYIPTALEKGAVAIVCEELPQNPMASVVWILVEETHAAIGPIACNFYQNPSHEFKLIGVTGTNGKTTVATLLCQLYTRLGYKCGLVSTVQNIIGTQ
eukprot:gene59452-81379_t